MVPPALANQMLLGQRQVLQGSSCSCPHTPTGGLRSSDRDHVAAECVPCLTLSRKACCLAPGTGAHGSAACTLSSAVAPVLVITLLTANGPVYSTGRMLLVFVWHSLFAGLLYLTSAFPSQPGRHLANVLFNRHLHSTHYVPARHGVKHFTNINPQVMVPTL